MVGRQTRARFLLWRGVCVFTFPTHSQTAPQEPVPGPEPEHAVEFNAPLDPLPMLLLLPVIQYYENVGARTGRAVVFGFRTKVEFSAGSLQEGNS